MVGTSGRNGERRWSAMPIAFTLPVLIGPTAPGTASDISWMSPACRAIRASALPLKGTCVSLMPAALLSISTAR
jgi:hypothetical protein